MDFTLDDFSSRRPEPVLKMDRILEQLPEGQREILRTALEGNPSEYPTKTIAHKLTAAGYPCSDSAVTNWRRRNRG